MSKKETAAAEGMPANSLVIPLAVAIAVLHIVIISIVIGISRSNREFSQLIRNSSDCQQYATWFQANYSTLSETAGAFVRTPVEADGKFNAGPLLHYAEVLETGKRGSSAAPFGPKALAYIDSAADDAGRMYELQLHAIALLFSVYPHPPLPGLASIPEIQLTEEELDMTKEQREGYAKGLLFGREYSLLKASAAKNIENCHKAVEEEYKDGSAVFQKRIGALRNTLWVVMTVIIAAIFFSFVLTYRWLITPLRTYANQIASGKSLGQVSLIREMRLMVNAYNELLKRHDRLESILRSAAETDALTGLPNRYSLQRDALDAPGDSGRAAVLVFDVDYLKQTNDEKGHDAGDSLLRTAAACIRECFAENGGGRCYRIGGDEFAAVLRACSEEEVRSRIARFESATGRENISVSVGCVFADTTDENALSGLLREADRQMYEHKKQAHSLPGGTENS